MTIDGICQKLGYTQAWIALGVVDEACLIEQWKRFNNSDDQGEEHYRWRAAHDYLVQKKALSDDEISRFLDLPDVGMDGCDLSMSRAIELIEYGPLSWAQFVKLSEHPSFQDDPVRKRYERLRIANSVRKSGIEGEIEAIKASDDSDSQILMLSHENTPRHAIEWLLKHGRNKAIRHHAELRLKRAEQNKESKG